MTRALLAFIALGFCSCATTHTAPRFDRPSTQPIQRAHKKAIEHVKSAQAKLDDLEKAHQELKSQIDPIKLDLSNVRIALASSEGARMQLDYQLDQMTKKANKVSDDYDKSQVVIKSKDAAIWRRDKIILLLGSLLALAGVWILRKPLLLLASGFGV